MSAGHESQYVYPTVCEVMLSYKLLRVVIKIILAEVKRASKCCSGGTTLHEKHRHHAPSLFNAFSLPMTTAAQTYYEIGKHLQATPDRAHSGKSTSMR